jgi:hypothetical protein
VASDYDVERLTSDTFAELAPLMLDAFGDTVDRSYFDWKYLQNPAGEAIGHIAPAPGSGEIAAFYGMIPEICRWGTEQRRIYQSCDTMTHSGHRRKGLFQLLATRTYDEARAADPGFFAYGFGGPTSTPGFLKMGWRVELELPYLFQPFPLTRLRRFGGRANAAEAPSAPHKRLVEMIVESAGERIATIDKNEAFVRWRLANPLRRYEYRFDPAGAYVIFTRSARFLFLFDFWERSPGLGGNVSDALRRASLEPGCKGILTFCQRGTADWRRLKRYGFLRNPFRRGPAAGTIPFITYGGPAIAADGQRWTITPFDHDSY